MRVGVITNRNLRSPWASTHFYMHRALCRQGIDAVHVAGEAIANFHSRRNSRRQFGKTSSGVVPSDPFTPEITDAVKQDIQRSGYDTLFAFHASTVIPSLKIECPLVYSTDATAALLNDYYPQRQSLSAQESSRLQNCEETTIAKSDAILVPTQWAANSVMHDYGAEPRRVHTIEWGGNLDGLPHPPDRRASVRQSRDDDRTVRFLLVGLDWQRKGGDIAVEIIKSLRDAGIEAALTVVGASIPKKDRSPYVRSVGKLNRANPEESAQLDQLFRSADFYLHPARAECYGHVLCEALSFGMPVIATQTGGIPQCVIDGKTGVLLPPGAAAQEFSQRVQSLLGNRDALAQMHADAVQDFRQRLNWGRWAHRVEEVLQTLHSPPAVPVPSDSRSE